jgi:hypothetical protein
MVSMLPPGLAQTSSEIGRIGQVSAYRDLPAHPQNANAVSERAKNSWTKFMADAL